MAITVTSSPAEIGLVKSPIAFTLHTDNALVEKIIVKVLIEGTFGSGTYDFGFSFQLAPDSNGDITFNIENRLKAFLQFAMPDLTDNGIQILAGTTKRYKLSYAEKTSTDLEYIESVYHEDKTAAYPHLKIIDLDNLIEVGEDYTVISETQNTSILANLAFELAGSLDFIGTPVLEGIEAVKSSTGGMSLAYDSLRLPANVNVRIYKTPVTYVDSAVFYAHLGARSRKYYIPPVIATSNLAMTNLSISQIDLTWQYNSTNETGFILERKTDGGAWTQIASLAANTTTYNDTNNIT